MADVRIVKLNPARLVTSGPGHFGTDAFKAFGKWFAGIRREGADGWFAWDFAWLDQREKKMVWIYAPPAGMDDADGFGRLDFPGGLYTVAISRDGDDRDGERVYREIKDWVAASGVFVPDERPGERETMFRVTTPPEVKEALGYHQLDIYVPIRLK